MQDGVHYVCVIGHAQMKHLCREEQWEMMFQAPSQGYLSQSDTSVHQECMHMRARTAEDGAARTFPHTNTATSFFITLHKSPIF